MNVRAVFALALALGCTACAVKPIDTQGEQIRDDGIVAPGVCPETFDSNYCQAIVLADGYRRGYLRRAGNLSALREGTGLLLIPATAAALYYGLSGREKFNDRILRLSTGAAGVYAAGQWSLKPTKEQAYHEGAKAMTCAVINSLKNVIPLAVGQSSITDVLRELQMADAALRGVLNAGKLSDEVRTEAADLLNDGDSARSELAFLHGETLRAGATLSARVHMLDIEVRTLVSQNSPTLDSLAALTGGLEGYATTFGSSRVITAPAKPEGEKVMAASRAGGKTRVLPPDTSNNGNARLGMQRLREAIADANVYLRYAETARTSFESVATCTPAGARSFFVAPDVSKVDIVATQTFSITVTDRVGRPVVSLGGTTNPEIELQPVQVGTKDDEYVVVIKTTATEKKVTGTVLSLRAANGLQGRDITLSVVPGATENLSPKKKEKIDEDTPLTPPQARYPGEQDFLDEKPQIFAVQCLVGADPDCRMGRNTRQAIASYRKLHGLNAGDHIDQPLLQQALNVPFFDSVFNCTTVPLTPEERAATCKQKGATP